MESSNDYPQAGMYVMGHCLIVSIQVELYDDVVSQIQQDVLAKVREAHIRGVIVDVSMVEIMDAHIAQCLAETVQMVEMLGAGSIVVGLRPAVASALMDLDAPPLKMRTAVTLEQGMSLLEPYIRGSEILAISSDEARPIDNDAREENAASLSGDSLTGASNAYFDPEGNSGHKP